MGWYIDLPLAGERGVRDVSLRMGNAVMISTIPYMNACNSSGTSVLYQVKACNGGQTPDSQFDVNNNFMIDTGDKVPFTISGNLPPSGKIIPNMLFEPIEIGDLLYLPNAQGGIDPLKVPPNKSGMSYWRTFQ
jgi:type IV pilus assembly protein PilY1